MGNSLTDENGWGTENQSTNMIQISWKPNFATQHCIILHMLQHGVHKCVAVSSPGAELQHN